MILFFFKLLNSLLEVPLFRARYLLIQP